MFSTTPDPFLIVGFTILMVFMLANIYILVYWQHPEDHGESVMSKVLIVFGLQLASVSVLMLPVDFANNAGNPDCDIGSILHQETSSFSGYVDFFTVWEVFFTMIIFIVVACIPFAIFFYEEESTDLNDPAIKRSRWKPALAYESIFFFGFLILILSLYFTAGQDGAQIDVHEITYSLNITETIPYVREAGASPYTFFQLTLPANFADNKNITTLDTTITMPVSFLIYMIGVFNWIGWFFFCIFVGAGLTSAPFDLILAYIYRPRLLPPDILATNEVDLQERTSELIEITLLLKRERSSLQDGTSTSKSALRKRFMTDRMEVNRLAQMVFCLERDIDDHRLCKNIQESYNPLIAPFKLSIGIFFAIVSFMWILQMIFAVLTSPQVTPFLSLYLLSFDGWFPMFGNVTYALLSLYLLYCTIKGCFKMSMRMICIKIHPMKVSGTYLNAFLFNLGIIMMCTIPLINFCVIAFSGYTIDTDAYFLFIVQANNLQGFKIFFTTNHVFIWIIMLLAFIWIPYLLWKPRDAPVSAEEFRRHLHARGGGYTSVST